MPQDIKVFCPVKITAKQWSDKLICGSVFTHSLYDFGIWNLDAKMKGQAKEMDNSFRGMFPKGMLVFIVMLITK